MTIKIREAGAVRILEVHGRVDIQGGDRELREEIERLAHEGRRKLVVNLKNVTRIDSPGVGELIVAHNTLRKLGGNLKIAEPSRGAYMTLGRFSQSFEIYKKEIQAVGSF